MRAALLCVVAACATDPSVDARAVPLAGDSTLVSLFERVGADTGIAPEVLAATSWTATRLTFAHGREIGLLGIAAADLPHAAALAGVTEDAVRTDPEASIRAGAALIRERGPSRNATIALSHGISGRDEAGARIVVAATGTGDYEGADWEPASTSNYQRANRTAIDHIVIHDTEGSFDGTLSWFQNPAAQVSAHYVVRSSDGHVVQMVDEKDIAWHDKCFNTTTVGIEHEGYMAHADVWYTEAMYEASAALTSYLADKYGIAKEHGPILGHGEAPDCSDHTDPGPGWDWQHYIDLVKTGGVGTFLADDVTVVDAPSVLAAGEVATVTVTITNGGTAGWDVDATRVGTLAPSQLYAPGDWPAPDRAGTVEAQTAPGSTGTFVFSVRAPQVTAPTVIGETFQLVENDTTWFGPTFSLAIQVTPETPSQTGGCAAAGSGGWACAMLALGALRRRRRR